MDCVAYIRVSTEGQVEDGVSLDTQRAKIQAWADLNGYGLVVVHQDAGISGGAVANRPGIQAAVEEACRRKAPLVVYSLSRLARSTMDALVISERLQRAGADLVSISEKLDTTTAAGKMVFRMLAVLAEFERDQLAERTRAAMQHLRRQRRRISRHVPYGWELSSDGAGLVANDAEQQALDLMRSLRASGLSYRRIADELKASRVPTKQGRATWSPKVIRDLLARLDSAA